jgi:hypothetical protein
MIDPVSDPIPANLSEAFDQAVIELIAWDGGGDEPSVSVGGRSTSISAIASLAETYKDTLPSSLFWRMVGYANRSLERRAGARELSKDGSYATGAGCLLQWLQIINKQLGEWHADHLIERGLEAKSDMVMKPHSAPSMDSPEPLKSLSLVPMSPAPNKEIARAKIRAGLPVAVAPASADPPRSPKRRLRR